MVSHMTDLQDTPQLVGSTQVCAQLSISRSALGRWIASGRITPAEQLAGGAYVFTAAEVERVKAEDPPRAYAHRRRA